MKMLAFVFVMLMSTAYAAEIKVLDLTDWYRATVTSSQFNINREHGRAWVEFYVREPGAHRDDRGPQRHRGEFYRQLVPGLSFDASRGVITLESEGQQFDCATVVQRGRSIFRYNKITNTGCAFTTKRVMVTHDNGYEVETRPHLQVFLITK